MFSILPVQSTAHFTMLDESRISGLGRMLLGQTKSLGASPLRISMNIRLVTAF